MAVQSMTFLRVPSFWYLARHLPKWLPGRTRLTRFLFYKFQSQNTRPECPWKITAGKHSFFAPSLREPVAAALVLDGFYEPKLRAVIKKYLTEGSVFIDVGANIGCHSFFASGLVGGFGKVLSIEASPSVFSCLQAGVSSNRLSNICISNLVAGEKDALSCDFYDSPVDKFGMGSMNSHRFAGGAPTSVPISKVDTLLANEQVDRVDLVKIDVEGYEKNVIEGAHGILRRFHPPVLFEFCDWSESRPDDGVSPGDAQRLLVAIGYKIFVLDEFLRGLPPLISVRTSGSADLIAVWP